jgi:hypothetical protein
MISDALVVCTCSKVLYLNHPEAVVHVDSHHFAVWFDATRMSATPFSDRLGGEQWTLLEPPLSVGLWRILGVPTLDLVGCGSALRQIIRDPIGWAPPAKLSYVRPSHRLVIGEMNNQHCMEGEESISWADGSGLERGVEGASESLFCRGRRKCSIPRMSLSPVRWMGIHYDD